MFELIAMPMHLKLIYKFEKHKACSCVHISPILPFLTNHAVHNASYKSQRKGLVYS